MKNYKIIDISWPINHETVEYKDKGALDIKTVRDINRDGAHETHVNLDMHTGTHIDAPMHFIQCVQTVEKIPLEYLIGECKVFDLMHVEKKITVSDLQDLDIQENDIILFKTKNSILPTYGKFEPNFVYLDKIAAQYLASKKIRTVGIDYLGIERDQQGHETHKILFKSNIAIIEGLRLANVIQDKFLLICLPIKFEGIEAACSRAVLLKF